MKRRDLLKIGAAGSVLPMTGCMEDSIETEWNSGEVAHILPLVSPTAFNIKVSFRQPLKSPPELKVDELLVTGIQQDTRGRFWSFVVGNLEPNRQYILQLVSKDQLLCDVWPLATFPDEQANIDQLKLIAFTCAGGPDLPVLPGGRHAFKPVRYRQKLYQQMLERNPDLVISNGDHVYWDYESWRNSPDSELAKMAVNLFMDTYGAFDDKQPVFGADNEATLIAIGDEQIASAYGVQFRSTPVFFVTDDHDYFDNDDASPQRVSFPPNVFHQNLRDALQALYFPEFLWDEPDFSCAGVSEVNGVALSKRFGACRYGTLFDSVLFDCGGDMTLDAEEAVLLPRDVERWILRRTRNEATRHFAQVPSHPFGWTAGKWREWYPDSIESDGSLLVPVGKDEGGGKYLWQAGWWSQHQRLLQALTEQKHRAAISISGDLHLLGGGFIERSGALDCSANPVLSILTGPVGVGDVGWLSSARGLQAAVASELEVNQWKEPVEENGFTEMRFTRENIDVQLWSYGAEYADADDLISRAVESIRL